MELIDKNNNLTLFLLLIGVIILVLCYKSRNVNERFTNDSDKLKYIKEKIDIQNTELESIKGKIKLLMKHNYTDMNYKILDDTENEINILKKAQINSQDLLNYHNSIDNKINNYDSSEYKKKIKIGINDLKKKYNAVLENKFNNKKEEYEEIKKEKGIFEKEDTVKNVKNVKNPYYNINLEIDPYSDSDKNFKIYNNNKCLQYDSLNDLTLNDCNNTGDNKNKQLFKHKDDKIKPYNSETMCLTYLNNNLSIQKCIDNNDRKQWWNRK